MMLIISPSFSTMYNVSVISLYNVILYCNIYINLRIFNKIEIPGV